MLWNMSKDTFVAVFIVSMDNNMIKFYTVHSHAMHKEPKFASVPLMHYEKEIYVSLCIK